VELFNKRDFVCDCGTTRLPSAPCILRENPTTKQKGAVSEIPEVKNIYNQNFQNRFCGCACEYDAEQQKGTMFQCLGLGTPGDGGCGEDWWHPACVMGLDPSWHEEELERQKVAKAEKQKEAPEPGADPAVDDSDNDSEDDLPVPPGFPDEDDFEGFICYMCVDANPWIKRYAGTKGFLPPVFKRSAAPSPELNLGCETPDVKPIATRTSTLTTSQKRKADDSDDEEANPSKRVKDETGQTIAEGLTAAENLRAEKEAATTQALCKYEELPAAPEGQISLFFKTDFREYLCRCADCFPQMAKHPQLLEEEEAYEPPVSEDGEEDGGSTVGSGSLLDRGERALSSMDRVKALEGVMAFNHLKEKLTPFFKEFAESGRTISAEDIKAHFAKMRGDEAGIKEAGEAAASSEKDSRKEQDGY
jgi:E3 ubiquitin-protein ligase UBR7